MRSGWIVSRAGGIHWATLHEGFDARWLPLCKRALWPAAKVHELDRRPRDENVCVRCRARMGIQKPTPRQIAMLYEDDKP